MSIVHHTKLQINGPSGHCSHLDFHSPPELQQFSTMLQTGNAEMILSALG